MKIHSKTSWFFFSVSTDIHKFLLCIGPFSIAWERWNRKR